MGLSEFIAAQLRQPKGVFGRIVMAGLLNLGNAELIDGTLEALGLRTEDDFLDVGFGGGPALALASRSVRRGSLSAPKQRRGAVERLSIADEHGSVTGPIPEGRVAPIDRVPVAHDGHLDGAGPLP